MIFSQTELLEKNVYLVEHIKALHERMVHMKAVVLARPTPETLEVVRRHFPPALHICLT